MQHRMIVQCQVKTIPIERLKWKYELTLPNEDAENPNLLWIYSKPV